MSRIKGKDTVIEMTVRKELFRLGFRFRKNVKDLPGKPDIVLPKYKTAIFIHGCFWHRHKDCKNATTPKTRTDFWIGKFQKNVENDLKHYEELSNAGWRVYVMWECDIEKHFDQSITDLIAFLRADC